MFSPNSLSMNCTLSTPYPQNARSLPLSNPIATDSFIELDIDVNNSNSNTLEDIQMIGRIQQKC